MAKQPKEEPNPILQHLFNTPIKYGLENPGFDIPTYRDVSDDFDTFEGSRVDPLGGVNFEVEDDWLAKRDAEQSRWDKWANGSVKALGKLATSAIEGVGSIATIPYGLVKGVSTGDWSGFYDNALGNGLDAFNDALTEALPNYSSRRDTTFDADFWADQFLGGAGYMGGALLGGKGLGLIGKGFKAGAIASGMNAANRGAKVASLANTSSKLAQYANRIKNPAQQLAYSTAMAASEAAIEARDTKDTLYQDLLYKRDSGDPALQGKTDVELMDMSKAAGNAAFAFNLPIIAGTQMFTFGKAALTNYNTARKTFDLVGDIGKVAVKNENKIIGGLKRFGEGAISEGSQELGQLGISEGAQKFYLGQYSSSAEYQDSLIRSVFDETVRNFGTKEGFESMFLGAILGGPTSVFTGSDERKLDKERATKYADLLNTPEMQSIVSVLNRRKDNANQTANASAQQDAAVATGDKFTFKNSEYDSLKGLTKEAIELGGAETLINKFEALKNSDIDEYNAEFNPNGEFIDEQKRNEVLEKTISTIKNVAKAYDNILVNNPRLNPLVKEATPQLTQAKRNIFDAIFDAVTNFEDIDTREKEIASEIMGLTATTDSKMVASIYGPYMKEYVKKGIDYEKFRNSDDYKEKYGNTVQEYIDAVKEENPDKAAKLETLSKDLFKLAERREEMIKQYNEAIEQPEKIQKEAEEAIEKVNKEKERLKAEADKQAAEALKEAEALRAEGAATQAAEEAFNPPLTPEEMLGGTPGTVVEPKPVLPVSGEIVQTNASLQEINDAIDELEEQLFYEESDENTEQVAAINEQLKVLYEQKKALEESLSNKIDEEDKALKAIEAQKEEERKEEKKKQEEEEAKKAATQKVVVPENKKEAVGFRTFGKLIPPTSQKDKTAAQKILNTTPLKELLAGLTISISPYEGTDTVGDYVTWAASKVGIAFSYKGTVLGYLPNPNKIIINETGQGWGDLSLADKQKYFKLDEPKGTPITFDMIDAERDNLLEIYKNLENKEGEFTLAQLPFIQVTPSLGEYLVLTEGFPTLAEIEDTYTVVKNNGELVIYDTAKENTVNDNLPKKLPVIPEKLKKTNRYLLLVNNGYEQRWIAMQPTPLLKTEFADIYKDVLALQKRILAGENISQEELDLANNAVKQKYFVAENRKDKKYTFASLSNKGTFTLREVSFKRGNKESDKVVDGKSGIKTIDKVYEELFKIGTIKGNEETLRATVGFKNGGLKVTINKAEAEKVKAEKFTEEPVVTTTEDKKADIEKRRQEVNNKNEEFIQQINVINAEEVADRDNLINKLIKNIPLPPNTRINNWVLEELNGKLWKGKNIRGKEEEFFGKENWDKIKEAKKQFDIEFKKIEDSNLAKIKLIEQKQSVLLSTVDGVELRRAWSLGLIEELNIVGLDETNFITKETELKKNGDLVETDNYEGYYYLSKPDEDEDWYEIIISKTKQEVIDKINAKYDAELAALESTTKAPVTETKASVKIPTLTTVKVDLASLSIDELNNVAKQLRQKAVDARQAEKEGKTVLGGSASVESDYQAVKQYIAELTTPVTKPLSKTQKAEAEKANMPSIEDIDADKFSVSNMPAAVRIQMEEAIAYLKSIVPFEVGDIDAIATRLTNKGITFGAFIDNVIYLNKAAQTGTEYHEAFHGVMSLFSTEERNKYLEVAKKEHKITAKQRAEFKIQRPVYQNYTDAELDKILLEEYLADKFMAWKQGKKEPIGFFAKMFDKIKNFFNNIKDYFSGNLDSLFHKIDSGKFKNRPINKGSKAPLFMALPYRTVKIAGTDEYSVKKLNSTEENNLLGSLQYLMVNELVEGDKTIKQAFDKAVEVHYAKFTQAGEESALEGEEYNEYYEKNAGLLKAEYVKKALYEKLKSRIQFLLAIDQDIEDRILSKEESEDLRDYDKSALQVTGLPTLSQYVRLLIASSSVEVTDNIGVTYRRALNPSTVYNGIERTLLNTKPDDFMKKLEVFSVYNTEVSHFIDDLKQKLNWNSEANAPGLDNKGEVKNEHIWNAFQQAFHKFKVESLMTVLDTSTGEASVTNSNFKDVDTQQVERWKVGFKNFMDKHYHEISMDPFVSLKVTDGYSDEELENAVREVKLALDEIGIKVSPLYIQYSILKNKKELTSAQENLMGLYDNFYGLNGSDGETLRNIVGFVNEKLDPFKEGDEGALARLKNMAMENAYFDETAGTSTFQNAKGELVTDNQLGSFFLKRVGQLQSKQARSENEKEFTEFYSQEEDSWMVPLHFIATQNNPLYKHEVTFDKNFMFYSIDGIRAKETTDEGKETGTKKEGVVFKHMTPLEKILTFFSLYNTTKYKTVKEGKETKKIPYAYYYPQVIETASTGYAILLPVNPYYAGNKYSEEFYADMFSFIKNEHTRIRYLLDNKVPNVTNFTTKAKNGYKFFTNSYLSETVQAELKSLATLDDISETLYNRVKEDITKYVEEDFKLMMANLVKEGVVTLKKGEYTTSLLPKEFTDRNKVDLNKIRSMQLNYLVNGEAFNTLLHGDLAYKVKNPEDHVKRLKGANGAFPSLFGENIRINTIPDVIKNKEVFIENGKKVFKDVEEVTSKNEHKTTDGQAYTTLDFQIKRLFKLGKTSPKVMAILSKIQEGVPLTREELETLEAADCLLNPKKDLIYSPNAYIKMSALTLTRELTSYKVNDKWEALPGREREHAILENMLKDNVDLTAYESASKGTTIVNEVRDINGDYYGEQVSTKGVKTKITDGTQHLALIWSELPHDLQHLVEQLDKADQERIIQSTEYALSLLKTKEGVTTLSKVLPDWYDGLVATGASPQLLDIFRPNAAGNPSLNPNIAISIDKFTAMYLAHWSNNALKQKVAGAKFTLVSPTKVIVHNGKVIRAEQFKANPEAYKGYTTRELVWNTETTKEGKTILYSEAIVSSYYKELYNLKVGDEIPEDLAYMLGYRIPTEDKPSMTVLKIVDFLPAIYGSAIMVPEEVQFLSGADFDIDSLFAQKYDIYEKDGKYYKYGTATTPEGQFEEFLNYVKKETDVEAYQKTLLDESEEYQKLLEKKKQALTILTPIFEEKARLEKENAAEIKTLLDGLEAVKEYTTSEEILAESKAEIFKEYYDRYAELDDAIERLFPVRIHGIFKKLKDIKANIDRIKANKLASALRHYRLPASKTAFKAKYPDGKFKAVLNNEMLSLKIEMLGNPTVQNTLAFEKTSNEPLTEAEETLSKQFPETFTADKASLSFFSFNDLAVAMANNDAGSDGIGPTAVFNVLYQYLAKVNASLAPGLVFTIKSKGDSFNHAQFRGVTYKTTGRYERAAKRIVRSISALISAMTDNAKDPIAARLNLNLETLGPVAMMLGTGVSLKMALKIVNSAKVKELTSQILNASSSFVNETQYSIVQAAESDVAYLNADPENSLPLVEEQLNAYLLGKEEGDVANIALNVYLKARKASQYLLLAKDIVNLRKGVPATFAEVDKMYKSYTTLLEAKGGDIMGLGRILEVGPLKASTQALEELKSTATTLFISEHPKFKEVVTTVGQQTLGINKQEVSNRLSRDFNSFVSLSIFRKYLEDTKAGKTKKYKARFIDPFMEAFTKEALFESTLIKEVQNLQRNAKALGLENNRFLKYISTKERENTRQVDKIEGNTRQLRNPDYQEELINSFDDLYSNPKSRDTAIKLVAYILLKDGARYKNNSFQSEIPAYMFTIYSDALDYFSKNPNFVDATKIGDEFIKVWSLNKVNSSTLYYLPPVVKGKKNPIFEEAVKQKVFVKSPETLVLNDTREENKENNVTNAVMANYNFKLVDKMFVPNPFVKVGYSPYVLQKVDGVVITDLSNIPSGTTFEYASAEKAFKVTSLNAYKRGTSAYSFPLSEAIELYGTTKNAKEKIAPNEEIDEWADAIDPRLESMPATDSVSTSWIEQQRLAEEEARVVSTKEYKEIKAAEITQREFTPENITSLKPNEVFVFGSNTEGKHGAGAAKTAVDSFGAKYGQAKGLQGQSYGIVTKDLAKGKKSVTLDSIYQQIIGLNNEAKVKNTLKFYVTKLGTDLAGFKIEEIKQIWKNIQENYVIADNIILPKEFEVRTAAETATEDKNIASVMSPVDGLAEYGITIDEEFSDDVTTAYLYKKDIDPRVKAIVEAAEDKGTTSPSQVLLKIKEADTENVFKKFELC